MTSKRFKSWKRAIKRGHLTLNVFRDSRNVVHSQLVRTKRRFGEGDEKQVYMHLSSVQGDPENAPRK